MMVNMVPFKFRLMVNMVNNGEIMVKNGQYGAKNPKMKVSIAMELPQACWMVYVMESPSITG